MYKSVMVRVFKLKRHGEENYSSFLRIIITCGFHGFMFPFQVHTHTQISPPSTIFTLYNSTWRKVACALTFGITLTKMWVGLVKDVKGKFGANPTQYVFVLRSVATLLNYSAMTHFVFTKGPHLQRILQHCEIMGRKDCWKLNGRLKMLSSKTFLFLLTSLFLLRSLADFIFFDEAGLKSELFHTDFYASFLSSRYYLNSEINSIILTRKKSFWPWGLDVFLGVLEIGGAFYRIMIPNCGDWLILMCSFTLWLPASHLAYWVVEKKEGQSSSNEFGDMKLVLEMYKDLKILSKLLNQCFHPIMLPTVADFMFYYSTHLHDILMDTFFFEKLILGVNIFVTFLFFFITADACKQVESTLIPLFEEEMDALRSLQLTQELANHPVALTGNGTFVMNYSFLFSMLNSILTIFILCVQFQQSTFNFDV